MKTSEKEWTLELNIGFKGKANPVPVILSSESNAIKVTAKWFKSYESCYSKASDDELPF